MSVQGKSNLTRAVENIGRFVLGPWPIYPYITFIALTLLFQSAATEYLSFQNEITPQKFVGTAAVSLLQSGLVSGILWLLKRYFYRSRDMQSRGRYLMILFTTALFAGGLRLVVGSQFEFQTDNGPFLAFTRSFIVFILIFGTVGIVESRIRSEALRTEAALVLVERQRSAVLEAEERARKSIARLLHDQVQAALVTASLKLRQVQPVASPEVSERISSVVADLENLRSNQLRNVSQQLSPDFRVDGLDGALIRLGDSYNEAVDVLVRVTVPKYDWHAQVEPGLDMNLAAYRIVEQAVLNSAVHGHAAHVTVQILVDREHMSIEVVDDGTGIPGDFVPGTGHLVIDSWINSLGGNWSWEPGQHGGTALHARIPIAK